MQDLRPADRMWRLYKMGGLAPAINSVFNAQNAQQMAFIRSMMKEQRKNELYDIQLQDMDAVVFDLETTGFSPYSGDQIISIGAVATKGGEIVEGETFYTVVNPKRKVPDEVSKLTGITNEMVSNAPGLIESLRSFLEFVSKRVLVAHGSGHDKHFLNSALWKTSKVNLSHRLLDCMMIAKWLHPKRQSYCLDSLLDTYEINVTIRHHALEDSIMTAKLMKMLLKEMSERDVPTLGDLYTKLSNY